MKHTTIELWDHNAASFVIVLDPTGYLYTNQTGGVMCAHPQAQGVLLPLTATAHSRIQNLIGSQTEIVVIDERTSRALSDVLQQEIYFNKRSAGYIGSEVTFPTGTHDEAWIPFTFVDKKGEERQAILTYPNSD